MSRPGNDESLILPTREGYDRWAEIYDEEQNPLIALEQPEVARLLGEVRGLEVADVGCGTGRHASALARAGARVTALDFSHGMLDRARAKPGAEAIRFIEHDVSEPLPLATASFDRVLSALVGEHIARLDPFFAELRRICRPGGAIIISAMHPAMMLCGIQARFVEPASGREIRPRSFDNQISDYVMAAARARLTLLHLSEHAVTDELAASVPRAAKYLGWPMLFLMQLAVPES